MSVPAPVFRVAVPAPLRRCFDYTVASSAPHACPGVRVRVPFGRRELVGVLVGILDESPITQERLKPILQVLDREPVLSVELLGLLQWAAEYYHHPLGDVLKNALPLSLRRGHDVRITHSLSWLLTPIGRQISVASLSRAPLQRKILSVLAETPDGLDADRLSQISQGWRTAVEKMAAKGWIAAKQRECLEATAIEKMPAPVLTPAQEAAVMAVADHFGTAKAFLLHGVTGSGKTEVYLKLIRHALALEKQALVLVPEIGLTPQLLAHVRQRFAVPVAVLHSGLTNQERLCAWLMARDGKAPIILGTRSAVFAPMKLPGVIIVDEEHDPSYKQQEGFRYHARDVAVMRAHREGIPVLLGSATPSLDSLQNVAAGNYQRLELPERTGTASLPDIRLLDLRRMPVNEGLSPALVERLQRCLQRGEQSLLFLNRRGYAPAYMCHDCGWLAPCRRCDAKLTLHQRSQRLRCHHCSAEDLLPRLCPDCQGTNLHALGEGTERIETALTRLFPQARIVRIDRDSTRRKGALEDKLRRIDAGEADILVGTQMLSKGHDFPNVTLVGVLNADQRLYSVDFRASEELVQQIIQVSGRAGRASKPGEVWIQTYHPDHAIFAALRRHDYRAFAVFALEERKAAQYPPFTHFALLRAESPSAGAALKFVKAAYDLAHRCLSKDAMVELMDPMPAPMERRAGRYRAQLLVQSHQRRPLHRFLTEWLSLLEDTPPSKRVRWSLDVDPIDMY